MSDDASRRDVLRTAVASLASAVALSGCIGMGGDGGGGSPTGENGTTGGGSPTGGNGTTGGGTTTADGQSADVRLGGKVAGWIGQKPQRIDEKMNPTLQFTAGKKYTLVWENLDGVEHELIIEDADGKELVATESASEKGATRSVTFTATEKMAEYYCEYHPQSMRGKIQFGGGSS